MAQTTEIAWCDSTFNPWIGCTKVSPGCDNCYAKRDFDDRKHRVVWGAGQARSRTKTWGDPVKWNKAHEAFFAEHGRRQRVFCASLADVFDNEVPWDWRRDLFALIADTPNLDWLLLTKRIGNVRQMLNQVAGAFVGQPVRDDWLALPNVWLGATVVNQEEADRDIPKLLAVPARVRFLSMEPLLGPVDLKHIGQYTNPYRNINALTGSVTRGQLAMSPSHGSIGVSCGKDSPALDWVIVGGESGHGARPAHVEWVRSIVRQCREAGVPVLVKQLGAVVLDDGMSSPGGHWPIGMVREPIPRATEHDPAFVVRLKHKKGGDWAEWPEDLRIREFPHVG